MTYYLLFAILVVSEVNADIQELVNTTRDVIEVH
jgi:hypothetical protein